MANKISLGFLRGFTPKLVLTLRSGYSPERLRKDVLSGITIGVIALPLAIAFSIGAGGTPAQGLWTAIIAGFSIAALGGSQHQVAGPTGAFVVIIAGVIATHGMGGLMIATFIAGLLLVFMGLSGLGRMVKFIPYPVTTGFTTGIGFIIAGGQLKDILGLSIPGYGSEFFERIGQVASHLGTFDPSALAVGAGTLACIVLLRRLAPRLPAAIIAIAAATALTRLLDLPVETIGSRYGDIPRGLPSLSVPALDWATVRAVFPSAITIALLGAIESLLSAVVADGMSGDRHDSSMELVAQGAGNVLSSLFGGLPATGAIARTAANIKNGATSPVSSMIHAIVLLLFTLAASGLVSGIPLASLAAILLVVAWDMSEFRRFFSMRYAPKSDLLVMLVTFALTVAIDLTVAVEVGVILAVFLFLRRIADTASIGPIEDFLDADSSWKDHPDVGPEAATVIPPGTELYEINGPFFFGTADFLQDVLDQMERPPKAFILRLRKVPTIDATALNALESFRRHCARHGTALVLSGVHEQPRKAMENLGLIRSIGPENVCGSIDLAVERVTALLAERREGSAGSIRKHGRPDGAGR